MANWVRTCRRSSLQLICFVYFLGGKRKRLPGGGKKLKFIELDAKLFDWFRSRRSAVDLQVPSANGDTIRRERVTFKQLHRQGNKLSEELKHVAPSIKWYGRFMRRHRLSLQRPKRNQKIPLSEAHRLATSFYSYLRRASGWAPKRGSMGAFLPQDVCNMDESPLALFGDQSKRSLNDVNTCNEVEGCLSTKVNRRISTVIARVTGILIFRDLLHSFWQCLRSATIELALFYSSKVKVRWTELRRLNTPKVSRYFSLPKEWSTLRLWIDMWTIGTRRWEVRFMNEG